VLATASTANQHSLHRLGVDVMIDYTREDAVQVALSETDGQGVDAVFDTVGGDLIAKSVMATRPFGRLAAILDPAEPPAALTLRNQTLYGIFLTREAKRLQEMTAWIEHSGARPLIAQVLDLTQVRQAHERLDTGHGTGKMVLNVSTD
jgi:NADPH2:quinone reductase